MKIRTDYVTNSSSSSFILGKPAENKLKVKDAKKYLGEIQTFLGLKGIACEHIIDLKYDKDKKYEARDVSFVLEAILWYSKEHKEDDYIWFINSEDAYNEIELYQKEYTDEETKYVFDYAHEHLGEILVGNTEASFAPYEVYDNCIKHNDSIVYKSNHMG